MNFVKQDHESYITYSILLTDLPSPFILRVATSIPPLLPLSYLYCILLLQSNIHQVHVYFVSYWNDGFIPVPFSINYKSSHFLQHKSPFTVSARLHYHKRSSIILTKIVKESRFKYSSRSVMLFGSSYPKSVLTCASLLHSAFLLPILTTTHHTWTQNLFSNPSLKLLWHIPVL